MIADKDGAGAAELADLLGGRHVAKSVDLAVESDVVALFEEIRGRFGRIEVLVNCAAIADTFVRGIEIPQQIERVLDVNLTGTFTCAREAIKSMDAGGVILNLGSINSFLPFVPRHAYGASRAGMNILTRCMAAELGSVGIRTATVALGYIRTPDIAQLVESGCIDSVAIKRRIPMGRMGEPEDVAEAVFFLASPDASYVNGSTLYVDGGLTSLADARNAQPTDQENPTECSPATGCGSSKPTRFED